MKSYTFNQAVIALIAVVFIWGYVNSEELNEKMLDDAALKEAVQQEQQEAAERKRIYARLSAEGAYMTGIKVAAK